MGLCHHGLFIQSTVSSLCFQAPQEISGHTSAIKKALWCNNDKQILSAADDKTIRSVKWLLLVLLVFQHPGKFLLFMHVGCMPSHMNRRVRVRCQISDEWVTYLTAYTPFGSHKPYSHCRLDAGILRQFSYTASVWISQKLRGVKFGSTMIRLWR